MQRTGNWAVLVSQTIQIRPLRSLEKIVLEELRHATHSVELRQASEHMSLIRIDFNLIRNFMQLQNLLMVIPAEENACSPETEEAMISR